MTKSLHPYLNFKGQTADAMNFYKSVFGGELTVQTYGDGGAPVGDEEKALIMHAELKTDSLTFFAADGNVQHPVHMGDNISMSLMGDDDETLSKWFTGLSEGGKVDMPLDKAPWGDKFGMLTDKFGVHWLVNISAQK